MTIPDSQTLESFTTRYSWAGYLIGFALGGFFDGILLHQILQWHHLLSGLQGRTFLDLRVQVLADGLFHAAMYVVAVIGLWRLWRARSEFARLGAGRWLLGGALIGFGAWHVVDGILSHWALGLHRIRMDSEIPMLWDLIWFIGFGICFIAAGWHLRRRRGPGAPTGRYPGAVPILHTLAVLVAGAVAALPPPNSTGVLVLFRPGLEASEILAAMVAADARPLWTDASGDLWAIDLRSTADARLLYAHGAIFISNGVLPAGCFTWSRV